MGSKRLDFIMGSALSARWRGRCRELRHELLEIRITSLDSHWFVHILSQEFEHFGPLLDGEVHARVRTAPISTDGDEISILLIRRIDLFEAVREVELLTRGNLVHRPADRG